MNNQKNERKKENDYFAYEIAKQISEHADTYIEACYIIEQVKKIFDFTYNIHIKNLPADITDGPIDNWNHKYTSM